MLHYRVLGRRGWGTWLKIELETGRTHQIRIQCGSRGHPVLGDALYGAEGSFGPLHEDERLRPIALHGRSVTFRHPMTQEMVSIVAAAARSLGPTRPGPAGRHATPLNDPHGCATIRTHRVVPPRVLLCRGSPGLACSHPAHRPTREELHTMSTTYRTVPEDTDRMPSGVPYIIGNEAAERFSYYGMRSILVTYMTMYLVDAPASPTS